MRIWLNFRTVFLTCCAVVVLIWFLTPVASINPSTCAKILPGMTELDATRIVGAPPGWYDGVGGISSDAPGWKGYKPYWVGFRGEMVVDLDKAGRVAKASFYRGHALDWSLGECLWERFNRIAYMGLSLPQRLAAFAFVSLIGIWAIGELLTSPSSKNVVANHGGIGLVVGALTAVAMFFDICFDNEYAAACCLSGPFLGAFFGMLVGVCRRLIDKRFNRPERVAEQPPPA